MASTVEFTDKGQALQIERTNDGCVTPYIMGKCFEICQIEYPGGLWQFTLVSEQGTVTFYLHETTFPDRDSLLTYLCGLIDCGSSVVENWTGVDATWMCRVSDMARVMVIACKNSDGTIEWRDTQAGTVINETQIGVDYIEECNNDPSCQCTTFVYEATGGETIDNATLIAAANAAGIQFEDASTGGATGISGIKMALESKGSVDATGGVASGASVDAFNWNGGQAGFNPMEGFAFNASTEFSPIPPFSLTVGPNSLVQVVVTVYKCN